MAMMNWLLRTFLVVALAVHQSQSGTRMLEPPSRASLWRYGYGTPRNSRDDQTNCGGYTSHYTYNNGKCGICGDAYNERKPRRHEGGGRYAPSPHPVRAYKKGGTVTVVMETRDNLLGKFEFRICPITDPLENPEQSCFDTSLLNIREAEMDTEYYIGNKQGLHTIVLKLPRDLVCTHCILQWRHTTGYMTNQHSCFSCPGGQVKCQICKGCGDQVWYVGCTDIAIFDTILSQPLATTGAPIPTEAPSTTPGTTAVANTANLCPCTGPDPADNLINSSTP